jgi:ATP-dependent Clp protease ATP-binding subunit ClpA
MIFMTSNLGAREMMEHLHATLGFRPETGEPQDDRYVKLEKVCKHAVKKRFSPEFINRVDRTIMFRPLDSNAMSRILELQIEQWQQHMNARLGDESFRIEVSDECRDFLLRRGCSEEYGARELKRTIHRHLMQPVAGMVIRGQIPPRRRLQVCYSKSSGEPLFRVGRG